VALLLGAGCAHPLTVESPAAETAYRLGQRPRLVADRFFAHMNLDAPELREVSRLYRAKKYERALDAYRDIFVERLAKLDFGWVGGWPNGDTTPEDLLAGIVQIDRHARGRSRNTIGKPGRIDWYKIKIDAVIGQPKDVSHGLNDSSNRDFATHLSTLGWLRPLMMAYAKGEHVPSAGDPKYLTYWAAVWEDFALRHSPAYKDIEKAGDLLKYNAIDCSEYAGLYIGWRMNYCLSGFSLAARKLPEKTREAISGTALANILVGMIDEHADRIVVDGRYPEASNQQLVANQGLIKLALALPDCKRADAWLAFTGERIIRHVSGDSVLPDGSDKEQSFGYNTALLPNVEAVIHLMAQGNRVPEWAERTRDAAMMRYRFLNSMLRPSGVMQRELLPGVDQQPYGDPVKKHGQPRRWLPDPLVDRIFDHVFAGKGPPPAFTSVAFPHGGYTIMRDGWTGDARHLFLKSSRPGTGHRTEDANSIQVTAFGRTMLIDSGPTNYTFTFAHGYMPTSFAHNTVVVDGLTQVRGSGKGKDYSKPIQALWHTSEYFDLAEGWFREGYGPGKEKPKVGDVVHNRKVIFLRKQRLWIVIDRLDAETRHRYSQLWNFAHLYKEGEVHIDAAGQRLVTRDPDGPNVALYHFGEKKLTYEKFYGRKKPTPRGWYKRHHRAPPVPAVDVHASWEGQGDQLLVTLIEPMRGPRAENRLSSAPSSGGPDSVRAAAGRKRAAAPPPVASGSSSGGPDSVRAAAGRKRAVGSPPVASGDPDTVGATPKREFRGGAERGEESRVKKLVSRGEGGVRGFDLELDDGTKITFRVALEAGELSAGPVKVRGRALLVVELKGEVRRGIALSCGGMTVGSEKWPRGPEHFEFRLEGDAVHTSPIAVPDTFEWTKTDNAVLPRYHK